MKKLVCAMVVIATLLIGIGTIERSKVRYYDRALQRTAEHAGMEYVGLYLGDGRDLKEWMATSCGVGVDELDWRIIKDEDNALVIEITVNKTGSVKRYLTAWI